MVIRRVFKALSLLKSGVTVGRVIFFDRSNEKASKESLPHPPLLVLIPGTLT